MKTHLSAAKSLTFLLLALALPVASSRAALFEDFFVNTTGNGVWESDLNWSTTTYPNNGHTRPDPNGDPIPGPNPTYNAVLQNPPLCTLGIGVTVEAVTIATGAGLGIISNGSLKLNGPLSNSGTIEMTSSGNGAEMVLSNGSRIEPGGIVTMGTNLSNNIYAVNHGNTLTIAPGGVIHGSGQLNIGFFGDTRHLLRFINDGVIQADQPTVPLYVGIDDPVNAGMANAGTLQAQNGATLVLRTFGSTGTIQNSGGFVQALDGSIVSVESGVTVEGGTFTTSGTGVIRSGGSGGKLSNITSDANIMIGLNEVLRLAGTLTNNGTIGFQSANPNSGGNVWFAGDTILAGNGAIEMQIDPYDTITALAPNTTLTNTAGHVIRGAGRMTSLGQVGLEQTFFFTMANEGLIDANIAGKSLSIVLRESDAGRLNNPGTLRASAGGNLSLSGNSGVGFINNAGGTVEALDNSTVTVVSNATVEGGTLATSGTGVIQSGGGKLSNVTNTGRVVIGLNQLLRMAGTITNNGAIDFTSTNPGGGGNLWFAGDTTLSGNGALDLKIDPWDTITALAPNTTLTNAAGHTIRGAGRMTSLGQVALEQTFFFTIANAGLIEATVPGKALTFILRESDGGRLNNTGTLRASGGGILSFSGIGPGFVNNNGGTVEALSGSTLLFDGNAAFVQTAGTIDLNGGTLIVQHGLDLNGGQLIGAGTVTGEIRNNGGFVRPGHSPGTITVMGNYTQSASGTLDLEIGGRTAGTEYDQLAVSGAATLDGVLNVTLINGFRPSVGDVFQVITPASFSGGFASVHFTGFTGQITYNAGAITITVLTVPDIPLNISTRLGVATDPNQLIGGLIITGSQPKRVLIRGIGPSLGALVSGALANPTLELFQGSTLLESNDNWRDTNQAAIEATGIAPTNDQESAIVRTLDPGAYTAIMRGVGGASGIGVVEAYDLDQAASSKMANISTRGFVDTGDNAMIGGFIMGGNGGENGRVVIRAIGPSLGDFGISGALQDSVLELRDSSGSLVASNDNWQDSQQTEIEATGLAPTDTRESVIVIQLTGGSYTAVVRGKDNTTGVAVVEVYNIL